MSREVHVRFCEGLGVRFLRASHPYIPMARGFVYLVAVVDWATRRVLAWRLSNSLNADFCVDALREAITRYGVPEIFNTDQGSQFSDADFIAVLREHRIEISMDGKGCWRDKAYVSHCAS